MWDIKLKATHEQTRQIRTHGHRQQYGSYQRGLAGVGSEGQRGPNI